ncbi:MAG: ribosome maturation factor RimP [Halanaerobiales bacterium]
MGRVSNEVERIAQPIVKNEGLELVDVEYVKEGENYFLRLFIDNEKKEIGLKECEKISNALSEELDSIDPIEQSYILEVSTPGIERPLKKIEDFDRFEGELVTLKTYAPINGKKEFTGIILKRDEQTVRIELKENDEIVELSYSSIASARLTVEF